MLDVKELTKWASLPVAFTRDVTPLIENTLNEYFACRVYIRNKLEYYGEDAFKNPDAYQQVIWEIMCENLPKSFEEELVSVAELMRSENCVVTE